MKWNLIDTIRRKNLPKALVLMYHRIAEAQSDVWNIAVSPSNFEAHLKVLQQMKCVSLLQSITGDIRKNLMKGTRLAITFDDGYADNFYIARPLLGKYELPATFFITSLNIGTANEFWWDELEWIFLLAEPLPKFFSITIGSTLIESNLSGEEILNGELRKKHHTWKAFEMPDPSSRGKLFLKVWEQLKPLEATEQQKHLDKIRSWAGTMKSQRAGYKCMTAEQLQELAHDDLCSIGMHSETHAALAYHDIQYQKKELAENKNFLKNVTGTDVSLVAYPYGNYNNETMAAATHIGAAAAFTTERLWITNNSEPYRLGRFQVENWNGKDFKKHLKHWLTCKDYFK